jgi:hypothetical protein
MSLDNSFDDRETAGKVNVGHRSAAGDAGSPPRVLQRGGVQMRFFRAGSGRARAHHRCLYRPRRVSCELMIRAYGSI